MEYYYKDGVIHENLEDGNAIGNIDNGVIRDGWCLGNGYEIGNTRDYIIHGMEDSPAEMVACWHFLISKIF